MKKKVSFLFMGLFLCALVVPNASDAREYRLRPYFEGEGYAYAYPILQWEPELDYSPPQLYEFKRRPLSVPQRPHRSYGNRTRIVYVHTPMSPFAPTATQYYRGLQVTEPDRPTIIERERVIIERTPQQQQQQPQQDSKQNKQQQEQTQRQQEEKQVSQDFEYENKSFVEHLDAANQAFKKRNYSQAGQEFKYAASMQPSNASVRMGYALGLFATGDYETAAMVLRRALKLKEEWAENPVEISTFYGKLNDFKAHLAMLERYINKHPQNLEAKFLAGYLNFMNGNLTEASEAMADILEEDPNDLEATTILGYLTSKQLKPE